MNVEFHPAALREVEDARLGTRPAASLRHLHSSATFRTVVQRLRQAPHRYPSAEAGTRRILLERFPFTVYYRVKSESLTIIAVAHQKRRPGYWSTR